MSGMTANKATAFKEIRAGSGLNLSIKVDPQTQRLMRQKSIEKAARKN